MYIDAPHTGTRTVYTDYYDSPVYTYDRTITIVPCTMYTDALHIGTRNVYKDYHDSPIQTDGPQLVVRPV